MGTAAGVHFALFNGTFAECGLSGWSHFCSFQCEHSPNPTQIVHSPHTAPLSRNLTAKQDWPHLPHPTLIVPPGPPSLSPAQPMIAWSLSKSDCRQKHSQNKMHYEIGEHSFNLCEKKHTW